jgi:hypothetical protein
VVDMGASSWLSDACGSGDKKNRENICVQRN